MSTTRLVLLMFLLNTAVVAGGVFVNYRMVKAATASMAGATGPAPEQAQPEPEETVDYVFFPVEKIILSLRGDGREHYFVLDLVLQGEAETDPKKLEGVAPLVRSSVVASLSAMKAEALRDKAIPELQEQLEAVLKADFAERNVAQPFEHVLVSKLIAQ